MRLMRWIYALLGIEALCWALFLGQALYFHDLTWWRLVALAFWAYSWYRLYRAIGWLKRRLYFD